MDLPALLSTQDGTIQEQAPRMTAVGSNGRAKKNAHKPREYGLAVAVTSVAYLKSGEKPDIRYCAVMLEMTLINFGNNFHKALIPFKARSVEPVDQAGSVGPPPERNPLGKISVSVKPHPTSQSDPLLPELDLSFLYPRKEEYVPISTQKFMTKEDRAPEASISAGSVGVSFRGVGNHREKDSVKVQFVRRTGFTETPDLNDSTLVFNWEFFNSDEGPYPTMHTAIVLVSCKGVAGQCPPPFSFTLTLSGTLKVQTRGAWALPKIGRPAGWSFTIHGNHHPETVDRMLKAYPKEVDFRNITLEGLTKTYMKHRYGEVEDENKS